MDNNGKWWSIAKPQTKCKIIKSNNTLTTNKWFIVHVNEITKQKLLWCLAGREDPVIWTKLMYFSVKNKVSINNMEGIRIKAASVTQSQQTLVKNSKWWFINDHLEKYPFNSYRGTLETSGWLLWQPISSENCLLWIGIMGKELEWEDDENKGIINDANDVFIPLDTDTF